MRNKKLLALSLVVALSFSACGKKETTQVTPTPGVTDTVTEEPTVEPEVNEDVVEDVVEDEVIEDDNFEEPAGLESNETLDAVKDAVVQLLGENYVPSMSYDATILSELFGVNPEWYDAAIAEGPMMSVHVDKFIAIHATEGNVENVANALNAYRDQICADTMQYPMNLTKIQGCVVETIGDYVIFSLLGNVDDMAYEADEDFIKAYTEINNSVIEAAKGVIEQ